VQRHADPLFEALASDIVARCLGSGAHGGVAALAAMQRDYDTCEQLAPFWFEPANVLPKLAFLIEVVSAIAGQPLLRRRRTARSLRRATSKDPETNGPPPTGLAEHRSQLLFDPLARDLDRIASLVRRGMLAA
jgi:hypothetical protein